jgi:hypothetical protein
VTDRPRIYYGLCEGGPWHQKHLADARAVFSVMIDPATKKAIPGAQAGTKGGDYVFDDKTWVWQPHAREK